MWNPFDTNRQSSRDAERIVVYCVPDFCWEFEEGDALLGQFRSALAFPDSEAHDCSNVVPSWLFP